MPLKKKTKARVLVSVLQCEELRSHHSHPYNKKIAKQIENQQLSFEPSEAWSDSVKCHPKKWRDKKDKIKAQITQTAREAGITTKPKSGRHTLQVSLNTFGRLWPMVRMRICYYCSLRSLPQHTGPWTSPPELPQALKLKIQETYPWVSKGNHLKHPEHSLNKGLLTRKTALPEIYQPGGKASHQLFPPLAFQLTGKEEGKSPRNTSEHHNTEFYIK